MSAQTPDVLRRRGVAREFCARPLEGYLARLPRARRPRFVVRSRACWRGYVATWAIEDGRLWLAGVEGLRDGPDGETRPASLAACFPWRRGPLSRTG